MAKKISAILLSNIIVRRRVLWTTVFHHVNLTERDLSFIVNPRYETGLAAIRGIADVGGVALRRAPATTYRVRRCLRHFATYAPLFDVRQRTVIGWTIRDELALRKRFSRMWQAKFHAIMSDMKPDEKAVGRRLRAILADQTWEPASGSKRPTTQGELAALLHVKYDAVNKWLTGGNFPKVTEMARLMVEYPGLTLDWIYLGIPDGLNVHLHIKLKALEENLPFPAVRPEPPENGGRNRPFRRGQKAAEATVTHQASHKKASE